jgi:1-hydroxycarotenoid 3,4-desaturase
LKAGQVVIVGAGIGGLAAALELAVRGLEVTVLERGPRPGGKMAAASVGGQAIDAGPTVLTMRPVFDALFARAGARLGDHVPLVPARLLARHAWSTDERLDLHADLEASVDAVGRFAGAAEARAFRAMSAQAKAVHDLLERTFVARPRAGVAGLIRESGLAGLAGLAHLRPFSSLDRVLGGHFRDVRLRQLFGRYATYAGSSPYLAPGPLLMIVHTERSGVWLPQGGMRALADAIALLAVRAGARLVYGAPVKSIEVRDGRACGVRLERGDRIAADAVVCNADAGALAAGLFGPAVVRAAEPVAVRDRSLSAITWTIAGAAAGFPLARHNVFFSRDYPAEFHDLFAQSRTPRDPTVYVCGQDRGDDARAPPGGTERMLVLVNAPADGDTHGYTTAEIEACEQAMRRTLERCGLSIASEPGRTTVTTPADFHAHYPATGGALYGRATHGWRATFRRPGARSRIERLYLAGGSVHPGAGVPMAALSGRIAALSLVQDLASRARSFPVAMPGGTPTR